VNAWLDILDATLVSAGRSTSVEDVDSSCCEVLIGVMRCSERRARIRMAPYVF
jgi:hypothetical protein